MLLSQSCSSWIAGQMGRVRLAIGSALPEWSAWPWLTSITSHRWTCSGGSGLFGFANQGSSRMTFPPGDRTSTQAWPNQVIVVAPSESMSGLLRPYSVDTPIVDIMGASPATG